MITGETFNARYLSRYEFSRKAYNHPPQNQMKKSAKALPARWRSEGSSQRSKPRAHFSVLGESTSEGQSKTCARRPKSLHGKPGDAVQDEGEDGAPLRKQRELPSFLYIPSRL